jgi:CO/xanthine dehydrogenase Mo-binding subunit
MVVKSNAKGLKAWRNDGFAKVSGLAKYTDDLKMHGLLHAVPVYSGEIHAQIKTIEISEALKKAGVVTVITAKNVSGQLRFGQIVKDYPFFADEKIRSEGDVVAIVVAQTRKQAVAAAKKVTIETITLDPILDPEKAMLPDSPLVHDQNGSNIVNQHRIRRGDISTAENRADYIIEQDFETGRIEHSYLEPETALCWQRADGVMEVYGSMQHPFSTRRFVAAVLGIPLSEVEVRSVPMGGGFGGKDDTAAINCARAALAAKITGKPVKITYDREWSFRETYKRHPYKMSYRMGIGKDHKIKFVKCRLIADGGAYCSVTPWVTWRSTVQCCGPYLVPNVHCDTYGVYTNNIFCGAMRGFGSPQACFATEQLIEMAADKLGISEIEMRKKNMLRQGSTTITGQKLDRHTVSLEEVLDRVMREIDYEKKRKKSSFGNLKQKEWYGIGLALSYRGMSLGAEGTDFNSAIISIQQDGSILLETGIHENGQGAETALIRILAEELGIDPETVRYRQPSTSNIPDGGTTVASRGTLMGGGAVVLAAGKLKAKMAKIISKDLQCKPEDVVFKDSYLQSGKSTHRISLKDAVKTMFARQEYPYSFAVYQAPKVDWNEETGQGNAYFTWVYGCQAVELRVNPETGKITLLNMVAAHDVGKAIDINLLKGQFYGGMAMGTGYGLLEEWNQTGGHPSNFDRYRIARSIDLPEMTAIIVENADPLSPSKAKGIGEPTNELMAPAIANALYAATGKRFTKLPMKIGKNSGGENE